MKDSDITVIDAIKNTKLSSMRFGLFLEKENLSLIMLKQEFVRH